MTPKRFGDAGGPLLIPTRFCSTPGRPERPGGTRGPTEPHPRRPGRKQAGRGEAERRRRRARRLAAAFLAIAVAVLALPPVAHATDDIPTQWQIDARAEALQRAPEPAEKPVICIIDTGVTPTPDLDIVSRTALDGGTPDDVTAIPGHYGHGTTVAHMAAAKVNGWGSSGAFPHARIASVRIFDHLGQRVPWQMYIRALEWCESVRPRPVTVVLSLGQTRTSDEEVIDLRSAVEKLRNRYSISVVAASGNAGGDTEMPARLSSSFAVTGSSPGGSLCGFSSHDESVDLAAPGCGLDQADFVGTMWTLNGTSFAAPIVAGALAALRALRPGMTALEAERAITSSARSGRYPNLDVHSALAAVGLKPPAVAIGDRDSLTTDDPISTGPSITPSAHDFRTHAYPGLPRATAVPRRRHLRGRRWPRPRATLRSHGRLNRLAVRNRPSDAFVEIRLPSRRIVRAASVITLPAPLGHVRVRFVSERAASRWATIVHQR